MNIRILLALTLLTATTFAQAAETVGKVGYMSGTLVAQRADGTLKVLNSKSDVQQGDVLVTAKDSYAQIKMNDGSVTTLRPHSNLKIEAFSFRKEAPQSDNMVLRLLKGGFRTLTGLIGKRGDPDAYKVKAATATIGIRGTDYSSRLCFTRNCRDDESPDVKRQPVKAKVEQSQVVGRVMLIEGELSAKEPGGKVRKLTLGAPVYEGDELNTGNKSHAVVAFRDEGRVTLQEKTVFQVEKFKYDKAASQENAVLRLLKGGVRVVTGLIGKLNRDNYTFRVANATIGIRGTGFDAWCNGPCASGAANPGATTGNPLDGAGVYVWAGEVVMVTPGGSFVVAIQQAAIIARDTGRPVQIIAIPPSVTDNPLPRPDSVPVDMQKEFGSEANTGDPGLYVTVHDGQVVLTQGENTLDLGRGETGFTNEDVLARLSTAPDFMGGDTVIDGGNGSDSSNPSESKAGCVVQ